MTTHLTSGSPTADAGPETASATSITVVVPTYHEAENIPILLARLARLQDETGLALEVLLMDDDSRDGSQEAVEASGYDWARLVVRKENRGLSPAVIDGFRLAQGDILVCMDCDLSHPPEKIPELVAALEAGPRMAIGSRYVAGATTDDTWGLFRWLNSKVATLLAWPLTSAKDPMSGFFAIRRCDFERARDLNPIGYKIALELIVKCGVTEVGEAPIHFADRVHGESKLNLKEQLKYLKHLRRLYMYKYAGRMEVLHFLIVGASGVVVNLAVLTLLAWLGARESLALAGGVAVSVVTNFLLNRHYTFSHARGGNIWKQFVSFVGATSVGMLVNYLVALGLRSSLLATAAGGLQIAALVGIAAGLVFNFLGYRFIVFRKRRTSQT